MDSVGCSFKTIMSLSILFFLLILLPLSLGQAACNPNPCLNGGDCRPGSRKPQYCLCPIGFLGEYCEIERRIFCHESPCINGGTCIPVDTGGYCKCPDNFWGSNCELLLESPEGYTVATIISMATGTTIGVVCICICVSYVNYKLCCDKNDKSRPIQPVVNLDDEFTIMDA